MPIEPTDIPQLVKGLAILSAIPVVIFALWADYFERVHRPKIELSPYSKEKAAQCLKMIRGTGVAAMAAQLLIFVGTIPIRKLAPLTSAVLFAGALGIQYLIQKRLERHFIGSSEVKVNTEQNKIQSRAFLWTAISILMSIAILNGVIYGLASIGMAIGASGPSVGVLLIAGLFSGIIVSLFTTFLLAPFFIRKILPCSHLTEEEGKGRISAHFKQAGIRPPELWILELGAVSGANAIIAGFWTFQGKLGPGLFLTRSLINLCAEREVDSIILHEISHLKLKHLRNRFVLGVTALLGSAIGAGLFLTVCHFLLPAAALEPLKLLAIFIPILVPISLSRKQMRSQEFEADAYAVFQMGADLDSLVSALRKLDRANKHSDGPSPFSTHPMTEERIARLEILSRKISGQESSETEKAA